MNDTIDTGDLDDGWGVDLLGNPWWLEADPHKIFSAKINGTGPNGAVFITEEMQAIASRFIMRRAMPRTL